MKWVHNTSDLVNMENMVKVNFQINVMKSTILAMNRTKINAFMTKQKIVNFIKLTIWNITKKSNFI